MTARGEGSMLHDAAFFVALLATAMALGGALAHALELPNKIGLSREEYFIVQSIYRGWDRLAYLLAVEFASILAVVILYRQQPRVMWLALGAMACLVAAQVVFWSFTFPTNVATYNWSARTPDWEALRRQWEYSHLAGAVFQLGAMMALIAAVLARK